MGVVPGRLFIPIGTSVFPVMVGFCGALVICPKARPPPWTFLRKSASIVSVLAPLPPFLSFFRKLTSSSDASPISAYTKCSIRRLSTTKTHYLQRRQRPDAYFSVDFLLSALPLPFERTPPPYPARLPFSDRLLRLPSSPAEENLLRPTRNASQSRPRRPPNPQVEGPEGSSRHRCPSIPVLRTNKDHGYGRSAESPGGRWSILTPRQLHRTPPFPSPTTF